MTATQDDTIAELQRANAVLRQERDAALAREAALAEVLDVINRSPSDAAPVFDAILEKAHSLCGADTGQLVAYDGEYFQMVASHGMAEQFAAMARRPMRPSNRAQRLIRGERFVHFPDIRAVASVRDDKVGRGLVELTGVRTILLVPLRKDGTLLGFISANRLEVRPFSDAEIALLESFAAQAVIAMENARLLGELRQRTGELAERNSEYSERIQHQAATIDVLKAMSASPGDPQPVFDLITRHAQQLCDGVLVALCEFDGALVHFRSVHFAETAGIAETVEAWRGTFPLKPTPESMMCRAIIDRRMVHIRNMAEAVGVSIFVRILGSKGGVSLPLMRDGAAIGSIGLTSRTEGGLTESQIELLKTFAEQAVIAIGSAETYRALQTRTADLQESLEYQTATSDVLKVISRSTFDLQPVLDTLVETAARLCNADQAAMARREGDLWRFVANHGFPPEYEVDRRASGPFPLDLNSPSVGWRTIREARVVHVHDAAAVPGYGDVAVRLGKQRTSLGVPLMREGEVIGNFMLARQRVEPFTDRQIELITTFADQAVIAIENTRLITEQREALEQQTATAEVLGVINANPGDLTPVFDAMLEKAMRLLGADFGMLNTFDGTVLHRVASRGVPAAYEKFSARILPTLRAEVAPGPVGRFLATKQLVHILDLREDESYMSGHPLMRALGDIANARTNLWVPLVKDSVLLGNIAVYRTEVRAFTGKEIALLENFAAQAVIAMENARLLGELRQRTDDLEESLEYQTATSDVLKVISRSTFDLQPVLDAVVERAARLCEAAVGLLALRHEDALRVDAVFADLPEIGAGWLGKSVPVDRSSVAGRTASEGRIIHVRDVAVDPDYANPHSDAVRVSDLGTALGVPLLREGVVVGTISLGRHRVEPFTDRQIELVSTFADQAVIAIENTRLLTEQQEALEQQTATAEVLGVINASPGDLAPVFDTILEKAHRICGFTMGSLVTYDGSTFNNVARRGYEIDTGAVVSQRRSVPWTAQRALLRGDRLVHIPDLLTHPWDSDDTVMAPFLRNAGFRAALLVPLRKDGALLGYISGVRRNAGAFSDKQIALLESFAAQAVIAIENARLLGELRERTAELAERNAAFAERIDHQAATIDVLKEMSASPGDAQPVFDLICRQAKALLDTTSVGLFEYDGELVHFRSSSLFEDDGNYDAAARTAYMSGWPRAPDRGSLTCRAILDGTVIHIRDLDGEPGLSQVVRDLGHKTQVTIPLMRDGRAIGAISTASFRVDGVSDTQIELLKTFAEQAVIAISSAETYRALQIRTADLQESLEYQTATSDVLKVISHSTFDLQPVLSTLVETAARLCDAEQAVINRREGDAWRFEANFGFPPAFEAYLRSHGPASYGPEAPSVAARAARERRPVHIHDVAAVPGYPDVSITLGKQRTSLGVPLMREGEVIGTIVLARQRVEPFTERQIELVSTFADQAVIAIENTRLITEQREALEQQTAMADVLRAINAAPGELAPVFDVIGERAIKLCDAAAGALMLPDADRFRAVALGGVPEAYAEFCRNSPAYGRPNPGSLPAQMLAGANVVHIKDITDVDEYPPANTASARALAELGGGRTLLGVALRRDSKFFGMITIFRQEVKPFSDRQIALLRSFADQAVIAMENARLLDELRQRQEELRVTFENMGDGVAMFDETQHLVAWNRKFQDILEVPDDIIARRQTFSEYVHYLAERGEYNPEADPEEHVRRLIEQEGQSRVYERIRPDGRVIEIRHNPVPGGGFVLIYADITERKRSEAEIRAARDAAETALRDLKAAQANLIQAEKMASLGQLTAGIAHEIKNPLNFVNNFALLSVELLDELRQAIAPTLSALDEAHSAEVLDVVGMLTGNLEKIAEHGQRADGIVRGMLDHSRGGSGERRSVDLNTLVEEALNLVYHGARAQDRGFNITLQRDLGAGIPSIELVPQDVMRVLLNLFSNGFYAARQRQRNGAPAGFEPMLKVATRDLGDAVEIRVRDNGIGIPDQDRGKLFQPFFTTKPAGEGTGLGLSISYDIITQQHGGSITVDSRIGEYSEFTIRLPRNC